MEATGQCIEKLHHYGIGIHGMFVADLNDAPGTIGEIVDYAIDTDINTILICSLTLFPGTHSFRANEARLQEGFHPQPVHGELVAAPGTA